MKISKLLTLLGLILFGAPAVAQTDGQQEMIELFRRVEKRLRSIDELLSDASTSTSSGSTAALGGVKESGIDELLKLSRDQSQEVLDSIDRILELSEQAQSQSQSPSSGSGSDGEATPQPGGSKPGSPLDRGQQTTPREATPEAGGQKPGNEPTGEQPNQPQPMPDPKANGTSNDPDPQNLQMGGQPTSPAGNPASDASGKERWGALPQHAQNVFRSEGGNELPAEYRDWIDAYHRRLNREGRRQ